MDMKRFCTNVKTKEKGFSLVEMMVVMLLIAVVLAASAPMITRKVSRERSDKIFDMLSTDPNNAVEYVKGRNQRIFMNGKTDGYVGIVETGVKIPANSVLFGKNSLSSGTEGTATTNLVGIGFGTTNYPNSVAIGYNASANNDSVAIGNSATNISKSSIAIGSGASTRKSNAISIGYQADARATNSIAIGTGALVSQESTGFFQNLYGNNSVAIGYNAKAVGANSVAIGANAQAVARHNIVLGTKDDTVYIPGNLIVDNISVLGGKRGGYVILRENGDLYQKKQFQRLVVPIWSHAGFETDNRHGDSEESWNRHDRSILFGLVDEPSITLGGHEMSTLGDWTKGSDEWTVKTGLSDRRLKNVGESYTAGLNELEKLNFYHFTFKKDEKKTPQVGVMAQDLQKVFPQAVTPNEEGWLTIRWDEMFYAAINAIKELNAKVCAIAKDVTKLQETTDEHTKTLQAQAQTIEQQQVEIKELTARVEKLEQKRK